MTRRVSLAFPRSVPTYRHRPTPATNSTDEQRHRAALTVAERSVDADDCRRLLDALGLAP